MKAVVVGGCGFLGSKICDRLIKQGVEVISVHRTQHEPKTQQCLTVDYREVEKLRDVLHCCDLIVHLASQSVPRTSFELGMKGVLNEVAANSLLFETAASCGVSKAIFASSGGSVYGECMPGRVISEGHSTQPISPHGLLKLMTELALQHVSRMSKMKSVSLRAGNIYGPGQGVRRSFGVVPTFLYNLMNGSESEIWGIRVVRDYIYVDDAADAFVAACLKETALPSVLNVGTGIGHTAGDIYEILQRMTGRTIPVRVLPKPVTDPSWIVLDPSQSVCALGPYAVTSLETGLEHVFFDWISRCEFK